MKKEVICCLTCGNLKQVKEVKNKIGITIYEFSCGHKISKRSYEMNMYFNEKGIKNPK